MHYTQDWGIVHTPISTGKISVHGDRMPTTPLWCLKPIKSENKISKPAPRPLSPWSRTKDARKVDLTEKEIARFYNAAQPVAALLLGVSLSSLKRRYYELAKKREENNRRWPYQSLTVKERKQFIFYVLNSREPESTTELDADTVEVLNMAFTKNVKN